MTVQVRPLQEEGGTDERRGAGERRMRRFNAMPVRTSRCARVRVCSLNQSIAHFPKCVGSEQLSVRPLGIFKNRGSVDGELLVYVKDAFLAACSRVHYKC